MNDFLVIEAIRKLPRRYVTPGVNVTRFGDAGVVMAHPDRPAMIFKDKKWIRLTIGHANRRRS